MKQIVDALGREAMYPFPPQRIICLCPAITETLIELGLAEQIVGRTKYCLYPKGQVEHIPVVGGTKQVDVDKILALKPELIITEKEDNSKEIVELLEVHVPVYVAQVESVQGAYKMIEDMGSLTNRKTEAQSMIESIKEEFSKLPRHQARAGYLIWRKPYMAVGATTYINDLLGHLGFTNPFTELAGRYPAVDGEALRAAKLDVLFLASEPFPFQEKHVKELQEIIPDTKIELIDGEMFWYGAKMRQAPTYFQHYFTV